MTLAIEFGSGFGAIVIWVLIKVSILSEQVGKNPY